MGTCSAGLKRVLRKKFSSAALKVVKEDDEECLQQGCRRFRVECNECGAEDFKGLS